MKKLSAYLLLIILFSCNKHYQSVDEQYLKTLTIQDTLVKNSNVLVMHAGDSVSDSSPRLLVKSNRSGTAGYYIFDGDCGLKNDSVILSYYPAFIIDDEGEFRKNGLWVYTEFRTKGMIPFRSREISFGVDSIPKNWNKPLPTKEGIYFYENNALTRISKEQSEEKFTEKEKNGFYFIPNSGRLYDVININDLD